MKHWLLSAAALALAPSLPAEARRPTPKAPTEGMVSAADPRAAAAGDMVSALLILGQVEQRLGLRPGAVDQVGGDAVIGDDREAEPLERLAQRGGKAFGVTVLVGEAERRNLGGAGVGHGDMSRKTNRLASI